MHVVADKLAGNDGTRLTRTICVVAMAVIVAVAPAMAQQAASAAKLPDAPSQQTSQPSDQKATPQSDNGMFDLLAGRSRMFPNLASDTQPLTPNQKFVLACRNSVSVFNVLGSAMGAGINQARNADAGYGQGASGYFKRFGASMAFASSSNLIGTYALASLLHQDPRFFLLRDPSFGQAVKYSVARVFVTRMDDGHRGINWSGMLGPLGASALANTYLPTDSQGVGPTFSRWGISLAGTAGVNLFREYWPVINRSLKLSNAGISPATPNTVKPDASKPESPKSESPQPQ